MNESGLKPTIQVNDVGLGSSTDAELLRGMRQDECTAFETLYLRYYADVLNFIGIRYRSLDGQTAEDVANEMFLKLWQQRHRSHRVQCVKSYLRSIVRNIVADRYRRQKVTEEELPGCAVSQMPLPEIEAMRKELICQVEAAMAGLSQAQRIAFQLAQEGQSAKRIATTFGCTENAARRRIQDAKENLKRALKMNASS